MVLCDIEGLSYEEIAATLGVKLGTVRSRIHRGRAQLRAALEHRAPGRRRGRASRATEAVAVSHLGARISALVDGELGHEARDRALAHVAHCADLPRRSSRPSGRSRTRWPRPPRPAPSDRLLASLQELARPGGPLPAAGPHHAPGPGRAAAAAARDAPPRLPGRLPGPRLVAAPAPPAGRPAGPGTPRSGRSRSAGLVLGTAFAAGARAGTAGPVVPPAAELSVEHTATTAGSPFGDPGLGVAATFGDASTPPPRDGEAQRPRRRGGGARAGAARGARAPGRLPAGPRRRERRPGGRLRSGSPPVVQAQARRLLDRAAAAPAAHVVQRRAVRVRLDLARHDQRGGRASTTSRAAAPR